MKQSEMIWSEHMESCLEMLKTSKCHVISCFVFGSKHNHSWIWVIVDHWFGVNFSLYNFFSSLGWGSKTVRIDRFHSNCVAICYWFYFELDQTLSRLGDSKTRTDGQWKRRRTSSRAAYRCKKCVLQCNVRRIKCKYIHFRQKMTEKGRATDQLKRAVDNKKKLNRRRTYKTVQQSTQTTSMQRWK